MEKSETQVELHTLMNDAVSYAKDRLEKHGKFEPVVYVVDEMNHHQTITLDDSQVNPIFLRGMFNHFRAESYVLVLPGEFAKDDGGEKVVVASAENIFGDSLNRLYTVKENKFDVLHPHKEEFHNRIVEKLPDFATLLEDHRTLH